VLCKIIFFSFLLLASTAYASLRCDLISELDNPILANNEKFWNEYSQLARNVSLNDKSLEELLEKHGAGAKKEIPKNDPPLAKNPMNLTTTKKADKEIKKLSKGLRKNYEDFLSIMSDKSGIKQLYDNPGRWRMEKLVGLKDKYTVRLNGDVRVEFRLEKNDIEIIQINADDIHTL
jgi:mRNA-degrading endonuclease RelE of RelBE toxin-antitoxin system